MHLFECGLEMATLDYHRTQPLVLFFRQSYAHGLAFDLARPLVAGPASPRATVLDVAIADPTDLSQAAAQALVLSLPVSQRPECLIWHEEKGNKRVNRAI